MTKAITDRVEETYKQVFGKATAPGDRERIEFLREAATGLVFYNKELLPLEKAVLAAEEERNGLAEEYANEEGKEAKAGIAAEIEECSQLLLKYDAVEEMRKWYLESENTSIQEAKVCVVQPLLNANMEYVLDTLDDCMKVLHKHRIRELVALLEIALKSTKNKDLAVRVVAETLLQKRVPEIENIVLDKMAAYHSHLKSRLISALESKNERSIKYAAAQLKNTGVPTLQKYAQDYLKEFYK